MYIGSSDGRLYVLDAATGSKREEFEAVKDMARIAREENEVLKTRIAALEAMVKEAKDAAKEAPPTAKVAPAAQEPVSSDAAIPNIDRPPE